MKTYSLDTNYCQVIFMLSPSENISKKKKKDIMLYNFVVCKNVL